MLLLSFCSLPHSLPCSPSPRCPLLADPPSGAPQVVLATRETERRLHMCEALGPTKQLATCAVRKKPTDSGILAAIYSLGSRKAPPRQRSHSARGRPSYLSKPPLEETLRGNFGARPIRASEYAGWNSSSWARRGPPGVFSPAVAPVTAVLEGSTMAAMPAKRELPEPPAVVQLLEDSLESARMRKRAIVLVATAASLSLLLCAFVAGATDQYVSGLRQAPGITPSDLYVADDGYAVRVHYYAVAAEAVGAAPCACQAIATAFMLWSTCLSQAGNLAVCALRSAVALLHQPQKLKLKCIPCPSSSSSWPRRACAQ